MSEKWRALIISALVFLVLFIFGVAAIEQAAKNHAPFQKTDVFFSPTQGEVVSFTVTLHAKLYQSDISKVKVISNLPADSPRVIAYDPNTQQLAILGLPSSKARILKVSYQTEAKVNDIYYFIIFLIALSISDFLAYLLWKKFEKENLKMEVMQHEGTKSKADINVRTQQD